MPGRLLVLGTARPELLEQRPGWAERTVRATSVRLEPLSGEETGQIVHELLGVELPDELRTLVISWADGRTTRIDDPSVNRPLRITPPARLAPLAAR